MFEQRKYHRPFLGIFSKILGQQDRHDGAIADSIKYLAALQADSIDAWQEAEWRHTLTGFNPPSIDQMAAHWMSIRQGKEIPYRTALDVAAIPQALPNIWLAERLSDGEFIYRVAGEEITKALGPIHRGSLARDLFTEEAYERIARRWNFVLDSPSALRSGGEAVLGSGQTVPLQRLILPLACEESGPCYLLGATGYSQPRFNDETVSEFPPTDVLFTRVENIQTYRE